MKIVKRLRDLHRDCHEQYSLLSEEVQELLRPRADERGWFYLSRLKDLESFALKMETGRVPDPAKLEDFFACTLVVPTAVQIEVAEQLVRDHFDFKSRRPPQSDKTWKSSSNFVFDDLRLYVARQPSTSGRYPQLDGLVFEVQVKTILQHAWSIATHDLIYKTDTVSWPRERIAYQVKAMLEHAEVAIAEANSLAEAPAVAKHNDRTTAILALIDHIKQTWSHDRLPSDIKRLAESIYNVFRVADIGVNHFEEIIEAEKARVGALPNDLSPYAFTLQALARFPERDFKQKFNRSFVRTAVFVHDDMDLPSWMHQDHPRIVRA